MSTGHNSPIDASTIERARQQVNRLIEEVARLSEQDLPPANYYAEFLERVLQAIAAPAGAVWVKTSQGHLQCQYQIQMQQVGINASDASRQSHSELLRQASQMGRPMLVPPHSGTGHPDDAGNAASNPTDYQTLLAPILVDKAVVGLVEIWQDPTRNPEAQRGFLQFMVRMAELASLYIRNQQMRQLTGQQQLWTQLESFARQIHSSLNPTEVAYLIANEGRRLVECDRVSIVVRQGKRSKVEAISGADVVEKRSNLVQLMKALCDAVIKWNEKLVYTGTKDDTLPPDVLDALDAFLAESNSKLLVVLPMRDDREAESKKSARSAIVMECFEPPNSPEQLLARLEVVGKHAASALYNAVEHRRIPMRFIWQPLARVQEGLGGKARAITISIIVAVLLLIGVLVFVPYPLKMDAKGQLLPTDRRWIYSPVEGTVVGFESRVKPGEKVNQGQDVVRMHDVQLGLKIIQLQNERNAAKKEMEALKRQVDTASTEADKAKYSTELAQKDSIYKRKSDELEAYYLRTNADRDNQPGYFWLKAPMTGKVLNWDFRENLTNRYVKPTEQLLRIGDPDKSWEAELKIPQKHIGQVLKEFGQRYEAKKARMTEVLGKAEANGWVSAGEKANLVKALDRPSLRLHGFKREARLIDVSDKAVAANLLTKAQRDDLLKQTELDVDLLVLTQPTTTYRGKLAPDKLAGEASPNRDDNNESDPVILASVRIDGPDIPADERIPRNLLEAGTEVHSKIRCGNRAMGYSLFYGLWEFVYEKIVFFF